MSTAPGLEPAVLGPAGEPPAPLGRGTLGRQLVIRVTALVALAAVLLSLATALATRQLLLQQVDKQVDAVSAGQRGGSPSGRPGDKDDIVQVGNPRDTIIAAFGADGTVLESRILRRGYGEPPALDDATNASLAALPVTRDKRSVEVAGVGHYRVATYDVTYQLTNGSGEVLQGRVVVGVPLAEVDRLLAQIIGLETVLSLLAVLGALVAARAVVLRSLRPLNRVAATAQQVSQLPLDRGEVALAVRVPPADADPTSEVGRVGQALNHMLTNVEAALEARQASETKVRRFVADASHELRNPLAAIRGYAELTRRSRGEMPEDAAFAMSRVESEAERMSRLVEDLLLLARLDSGPAIEVGPTDLTELVINAVSDARAAGPAHSWQLDLPAEPVVALGDRHRLHQVVVNLLANARTHTPPGTRVETGLEVRDGQAVVTVTDDGPGIPEAIQHHVFERFTRADTSRVRAEGGASGTSTGLGLAIVAAVVEAHRGHVTVSSRPGRTTFTVWLPLAAVPSAPPVSPFAPPVSS
ncbi:two-component system, OmpR family, sensor kinase [Friedmanniella luteola]|uniref:histidine kinase n=1 Tax=Friedmanniella luteola TaxID=546871 RepID=A0A1H1ZV45_9ACTN|nr:HAMP domain-containing sensor histidine kinase [Friedmanniella luteola]SDT37560.1 two-component system, OmpR family, sensor kinase [Friedmanniella luteola]